MGNRQVTFGTHRAVIEEPDLLFVSFEGPTTYEDVGKALELYAEVCGPTPRFLLADIGRSSIDPPSRKRLADGVVPEWFRGVVYVGASRILKLVTKALAVMVLFNARRQYEIAFADTEAEGRAIIAGWRQTKQAA